MPKLIILSNDADEYTRLIQQAELPDLEIVSDPSECDIVLGEPRRIRDALPLLPRLKWAQSMYAGVEPLVDSSQRRDYILTNARGVFGNSMSEFVFGYMLFFQKRVLDRIQSQQAGNWDNRDGGVLRGKTVGLLGVGSIGAHLAETAKHFGMKVWGYTRGSESSGKVDRYFHPDMESDGLPSAREQVSPRRHGDAPAIQRFARGLDYLVSVLPRTKDTDKIVNADVFNVLPPHAILINVGRGNAVDESALVEALTQHKLAAAVLDVTDPEPLPAGHPFWTAPNLHLTFHTSAMSYPDDITNLFIENYRLYIEGKPLKYQVDFERGY